MMVGGYRRTLVVPEERLHATLLELLKYRTGRGSRQGRRYQTINFYFRRVDPPKTPKLLATLRAGEVLVIAQT